MCQGPVSSKGIGYFYAGETGKRIYINGFDKENFFRELNA